MASARGLAVLQAIVQDYVDTNEPVGSKSIVDRHSFGVSAATIRNDMAALEDEELIEQPHTSSGRVPTDKGYRVFVDQLSDLQPLTAGQRTAITTLLTDEGDLDELLQRTVRLLSKLTGQVAMIQVPGFEQSVISHAQIVPLDERRLVTVVVTDTARVIQGMSVLEISTDRDTFDRAARIVVAQIVGTTITHAIAALADLDIDHAAGALAVPGEVLRGVRDAVIAEIDEVHQDRLVWAGSATLAERGADFPGSIQPLLAAIEEQVTLLKLLDEMATDSRGLAVSIGREHSSFGLSDTAVLSSEYGPPGATSRMGVLGPMRMDYSRNLAAARAVARYLTRLLEDTRS